MWFDGIFRQTEKTKTPNKRGKPDAKFEPSKFQRLKNGYNVWSQTWDISQEAQWNLQPQDCGRSGASLEQQISLTGMWGIFLKCSQYEDVAAVPGYRHVREDLGRPSSASLRHLFWLLHSSPHWVAGYPAGLLFCCCCCCCLTLSLPQCDVKTNSKSVKFEIFKPFLSLVLRCKRFISKRTILKVELLKVGLKM